MTIKNYVVRSLYKINNGVEIYPSGRPSITPTDYRVYKKMHELTFPTLKKYIGGEWELVLFEGQVDYAQQMHKEVFMRTYQLWSEQPCNILFVDLDIMAFGSVEFFDRYKNFAMFTEIRAQFYNCGLRYFPHTMDPSIWDVGLDLYKEWGNDTEWDRDQLVYSKMICSQPDFVFEQGPINSQFDSIHYDPGYFDQYKLLHFHCSKGPKPVYALMKKYQSEFEAITSGPVQG
jgi:hypothetical protein